MAREYQHALDEARDQATRFRIVDERQDVVDHWRDAKSWIVPPFAVSCDLLGGGAALELLVGYTRLGNLLTLLDREEVPEIQKHLFGIFMPLPSRTLLESSPGAIAARRTDPSSAAH